MTTTLERTMVGRLWDAVADCFTTDVARKIAALRADPEIQDRMDDLADRHTEGQLSPEELREYEGMVRAATAIAILQARARQVVNQDSRR
jgi:hypothetical protein